MKMVADKSKKAKLDEESNQQIDGELVKKLQEIQDDLDEIDDKESEEIVGVELRYNRIRKPVYDKRNKVIKSIPDFWITAFLNHPALGELLTEEDQKIFKYLSSLDVEEGRDLRTAGYSITFDFNPNPFFEDAKLTKTFAFLDEETTKVTATPIKWKEGKGLPSGVNHDDKNGNKRALREESFFTWFTDAQHKDDTGDEIHDEVADIIREDLWDNPLIYFNNEADEDDFDGDDDADDDKEEEVGEK
ncbi:NAP1-related protein 1 [Hirschfeldia incana]|nr:NAP1-related protein 1 [Hirschfeldia incana]